MAGTRFTRTATLALHLLAVAVAAAVMASGPDTVAEVASRCPG